MVKFIIILGMIFFGFKLLLHFLVNLVSKSSSTNTNNNGNTCTQKSDKSHVTNLVKCNYCGVYSTNVSKCECLPINTKNKH